MSGKTKTSSRSNGVILWQGASLLDGAPLVVIAVGTAHASSNSKTGGMLQTYILRDDVDPVAAVRTGADVSICGDCPHRGHPSSPGQARAMEGRTCYVNIGQGPTGVFKAYKRGRYPLATDLAAIGEGRNVRLGTYGDPAAVPAFVWRLLTLRAKGRTGYTHQWRTARDLRGLCMASVDNEREAETARALGWRYFRVAMPGDLARMPLESICPASAEAGRKLQCAQCLACGGADGRRGSIVIQAHGGTAVMSAVNRQARTIQYPYFARQE
jgi:hypothetical protein